MKKKILFGFVALTLMFFMHPGRASQASLDTAILGSLSLEDTPIDVTVSLNGKWIYVLTDKANLLVYASDGKLQGKTTVDESIDGIRIGPSEDVLFLMSSSKKAVYALSVTLSVNIPTGGSPFKGPSKTPVTMVVFSDFQCPFCKKLLPVFEQVLAEYPEQVKLVFKNYPIRSHRFAHHAALAALAAHRQGKFWEFHDRLFSDYAQLNELKIREIARYLGLDMEKFQQDLRDPQIGAAVNKDISDAAEAGVRGTPTVFINGIRQKNLTLEGFRTAINKELGKKEDGRKNP